MYRDDIHPLLPPQFNSGDIPSKLVDFIFEVAEYVVGSQRWEDLGHQPTGDREAFIERNDVQGDIELVKTGLRD
jgi:hypothetical protein